MDTLTLLDRLVAFPTVPPAQNLDLLAWVETVLAPLRPRLRRFPSPDGTKANLFASLGPDGPGGLLLSGHTDVVSTESQAWTGDPFRLREADGRLVGRGATDMKGFLASALAAVLRSGPAGLARPIHLAFSYDEEVGCRGVGPMTDWLATSGLRPDLAVVGEPSRLRVVNAHKAGLVGRVTVTGVPGHSSQPDRGLNAVMAGAAAIGCFAELGERLRAGPHHDGFDPPWSTVQVTTVEGGEARNVLAARCAFSWEMRLLPGTDPDETLAAVDAALRERLGPALARFPAAGLLVEVDMRIPALAPGPPEAERRLLALLGQERAAAVPFGSEAGFFQAAGMPTVILGPGDIAQAHQPDEFIARDELDRCDAVLDRLVAAYCR